MPGKLYLLPAGEVAIDLLTLVLDLLLQGADHFGDIDISFVPDLLEFFQLFVEDLQRLFEIQKDHRSVAFDVRYPPFPRLKYA